MFMENMMISLENLKEECKQEARNILDFWYAYQDKEFGGFYSYSDFNGNIEKEHGKGVLLHARILWAFSMPTKF